MGERQKQEIGYLCSRGHFVFYAEAESSECGSKKIAGLFVEAIEDDENMFYGPISEENYTSTGYSIEDYQETVDEAISLLNVQREFWQTNA